MSRRRLTPRRAAALLLEQAIGICIDSMHDDADDFCAENGITTSDRDAIVDAMASISSGFRERLDTLSKGCDLDQLNHPEGSFRSFCGDTGDELPRTAFNPFK